MAAEKVFIDFCSSDEEVEDCGDENNYGEEELEEDTSLSDDSSDWSENDVSESDLDHHEHEEAVKQGDDDKDSAVNKVTLLLKAGSDLKALNVNECKAYLRKHGLRLAGTKAVCIERIVEHWRIKDGSGEAIYPRSSFVINCKGDVCKGDIVLFTQKVHDKYEKMKRSGKILGRRTVAGQVIKESYGTAKQQHTFTIEVLWCEGIQKLPPLYPLLVKGRNLYRLMTLRQPWANEADRVKVLSEKHSRGAAARRIMRERKIKLGYVVIDGKLQKPGKTKKPGQGRTRKTEKVEQPKGHHENLTDRYRPDISANHSLDIPNQNPSQVHKNPTQWRNISNPLHSYTTHSHAPQLHQPATYVPRPYGTHSYAPQPHQPTTYAPRTYGSHSYAPRTYGSHSYAPQPHPPNTYIPRSYGPPVNIPSSHHPPSHSYANPTQNQSNQRPPAFYDGRPTSNALQGQPSFYNARPASNVLQGQRAFHNGRPTSNTLEGQPSFNPHANISTMPATHQSRPYENHHTHHPNSNSSYNHAMRELDHFSKMVISHRADEHTYRQSNDTRRPNYR